MKIAPQVIDIVVDAASDLTHQRIDVAMGKLDCIGSRSKAASFIEKKLITVNGKFAKASYKLERNDKIRIEIPPHREPTGLVPLNLALDIYFEDEHCLVINKPSGLVVHPAAGHRDDTLVNALVHHFPKLPEIFGVERPGIVHRLDRDTSGLIVVAKTEQMHRHLSEQFRDKTAHRIYWAITVGAPKVRSGRIESQLARHPRDRKRFASTTGEGKRAITHYEVLADLRGSLSLLRLKLETGRTHQIRVHLSELGIPIAGDQTYGSRRSLHRITSVPLRKKVSEIPHLILHAAELGFHHLARAEHLKFSAPWPSELTSFVNELGWDQPDRLAKGVK